MITKISLLQWLRFRKRRRPKMSFRNSAKWFQKTSLVEVYKAEFSKSSFMIRACKGWKTFTSPETKSFRISYTKFSKLGTMKSNRTLPLTALLIRMRRATTLPLALHLTKYLEQDIVSLDNTKVWKPQALQKVMWIILMNKLSWPRGLKTWNKSKAMRKRERLQAFLEQIPKQQS